jgi:hypothetical protein
MTGDKFLRGLITPIDPKNIFFMLQSGYPADFILGLSVSSLNGLRNSSSVVGAPRPPDPDFLRALQLLREVQMAGAVGLRVEQDKAKGESTVLILRADDLPDDIQQKGAEVRRLMKLPVDQQKFVLTYSPMAGVGNELAVNSRSLMQILQAFATYVDVPEAHVREKRAIAGLDAPAGTQGVGRIRSGPKRPESAYVTVRYQGQWFWVDNADWQTKRALSAVMFLFTLADTGGADKLPLITIPAQ